MSQRSESRISRQSLRSLLAGAFCEYARAARTGFVTPTALAKKN